MDWSNIASVAHPMRFLQWWCRYCLRNLYYYLFGYFAHLTATDSARHVLASFDSYETIKDEPTIAQVVLYQTSYLCLPSEQNIHKAHAFSGTQASLLCFSLTASLALIWAYLVVIHSGWCFEPVGRMCPQLHHSGFCRVLYLYSWYLLFQSHSFLPTLRTYFLFFDYPNQKR